VKYRHAFHAGNFADVHKHVALVSLLRLLTRKDTGLLVLDTHAGRGLYDLAGAQAARSDESAAGIGRLLEITDEWPEEVTDYLDIVRRVRRIVGDRNAYPGSPLLALAALRPQDRLALIETQPEEHAALRGAVRRALGQLPAAEVDEPTIECADGFQRLAAWMPPIERRALVLIDPPYEDTAADFQNVTAAARETLRRLANAVIAIWYPIKYGKDTDAWRERLAANLPLQAGGAAKSVASLELWIYPPDNRVGLNGSGLLVINPPWQFAERARRWLPALHRRLDPSAQGGWSVG